MRAYVIACTTTAAEALLAFVANSIGLAEEVDDTRVGRGVASGLFNAATDLGQIVGPTVAGLVAQAAGIDTMFRVLPPLLFVDYDLAMLGSRGRRSPRRAPARGDG